MRTNGMARVLAFGLVAASVSVSVAQGPSDGLAPGQGQSQGRDNKDRDNKGRDNKDRDNKGRDNQGRDNQGRDNGREQDRGRDDDRGRGDDRERGMPPGQAKKQQNFRFRDEDRGRFTSHYQSDANRWRGRRRPVFVQGQMIPQTYVVRVVPQNYWQGAPPPPPGYQYGYYGGYVVAYNPTTRIIADVLDLVTGTAGR